MTPVKISCESCPARNVGVFSDLSRDELRDLSRSRTVNTYKKRNIIFYEGNPALGVYCVLSGKVKLCKHGTDGHIQIVRLAKSGNLIGYRAFFSGEAYAATAEVLEEASICFMDRATVMRLITKSPPLALKVLQEACREIRRFEERNVDLVQKPVPQRVAELLLNLTQSFGEDVAEGIRINISLTREEMAEMAGTRAETLIRILGSFKQQGLLETAARNIIVKDADALKKIVPTPA